MSHTCVHVRALQAESNLGALGWRLNSAEVSELDQVAGRLKKGAVQNIFQTS